MKRINELSITFLRFVQRTKAHDFVVLAQLWFIVSILTMNSTITDYYTRRYSLELLDIILIIAFAVGATIAFAWREHVMGFYVGGVPVLVFGLAGLWSVGLTIDTGVFITIALLALTRIASRHE